MYNLSEFGHPRAYIAEFEEIVGPLAPASSAGQFEEALRRFGNVLGFNAERPEQDYGGDGPDVLWRTDGERDFVIEVKSRKQLHVPLKKVEHGQLLVAGEWFTTKYPDRRCRRIMVHPNAFATNNANAEGSYALTLDELNRMIGDLRHVLQKLIESGLTGERLETLCDQLLAKRELTASAISDERIVAFTVRPEQEEPE